MRMSTANRKKGLYPLLSFFVFFVFILCFLRESVLKERQEANRGAWLVVGK